MSEPFEEMAAGPIEDTPLCRACGKPAVATRGMYAFMCDDHAAAKKATRTNGHGKVKIRRKPQHHKDALATALAELHARLDQVEADARIIRAAIEALEHVR
jgi:hypothetical protein